MGKGIGIMRSQIPQALVASKSREWYSPSELVEPARKVFGGFDLDPASCFEANQTVRATRFFSASDNGLIKPWGTVTGPSRVWLNPPSDEDNRAAAWWVYLAREFMEHRVRCAAFVVFNLSTVQVALRASRTANVPPPQWGSRVEPLNRIRYMRTSASHPLPGIGSPLERSSSPPHPSAVILLSDEPILHEAWRDAYANLGEILPFAKMPVRGVVT
jgi:hypothetical protein